MPIDTSVVARQPSGELQQDEPDRKRRRKALSCFDCRRRKLKCDREYPVCGRCRKGDIAASCTYETRAGESINDDASLSTEETEWPRPGFVPPRLSNRTDPTRHSSPVTNSSHSFSQERRIALLERRLEILERSSDPPPVLRQVPRPINFDPHDVVTAKSSSKEGEKSRPTEPMVFRGKSFKTIFNGATHSAGTLVFVRIPYCLSLVKCLTLLVAWVPTIHEAGGDGPSTKSNC
jgi:hypothetical protein